MGWERTICSKSDTLRCSKCSFSFRSIFLLDIFKETKMIRNYSTWFWQKWQIGLIQICRNHINYSPKSLRNFCTFWISKKKFYITITIHLRIFEKLIQFINYYWKKYGITCPILLFILSSFVDKTCLSLRTTPTRLRMNKSNGDGGRGC